MQNGLIKTVIVVTVLGFGIVAFGAAVEETIRQWQQQNAPEEGQTSTPKSDREKITARIESVVPKNTAPIPEPMPEPVIVKVEEANKIDLKQAAEERHTKKPKNICERGGGRKEIYRRGRSWRCIYEHKP
jgi:hypothetical protein